MHLQSEWRSKRTLPLRYAAGILLAVAAQAVRLPLDRPTAIPYITYVPFIMLSSWFGGLGSGALTTGLCVLESLYFGSAPIGSFRVDSPQNWIGLGALTLSGVVTAVLFEQLGRAQKARATAKGVRVDLATETDARQLALESIIQHSPAAIALLRGPDFRIVTANPAYEALARGERMVGRTVADVFPEAAPAVVPLLQIVRDERTVYQANSMVIPFHRETGAAAEERYFNLSYVPVREPTEDGTDVLVVAIEVTEQRKAEQELRAAYTELAAIYANTPVILMVVDEDLRVEKLNDLGVRFTGRAISELVGLRPGGALRCVEALADPRGCGYGAACTKCSLRTSIVDSVRNGAQHEGIEAWMPVTASNGEQEQRCLLVSTAPLHLDHRRKVLVCAQDITVLKNAAGKLESALAEKTVLLQEIHHRVKNNLAVISSLLNMKAQTSESAETKLALEESQRRVQSMALIHEHLYGGKHLDRIDFAEYVKQLVQTLDSAMGDPGRIAIRLDIDPIDLSVHQAVPVALILNELLSNAFKHAFPDRRPGEIHVTFRESEPGYLELAVADDGGGLPDLAMERQTKSLGLEIVRILTSQLGGTLRQEPGSGMRTVLRFPVNVALRAAQ
jgi:PAS domain S-box-containing protein